MNRLFDSTFGNSGTEAALTTWAPAVDIYETENELVLKADLPDVNEKDLEVRVENNMLALRGERKFENTRKTSTCAWSVPMARSAQLQLAQHVGHREDSRRLRERRADRSATQASGV